MKIYRHRGTPAAGPPLTIHYPDGIVVKAKHGLGATQTAVQKVAEMGEPGQVWRIFEYETLVSTITRTQRGVHTMDGQSCTK